MHNYAQTNIQLFNQLREGGVSKEKLEMIYRGYKLAMRLLTGRFRPSGKTFIAHVVGTASILHAAGASIEVVAAGLLHSAYDNGDFGSVFGSATAKRRAVVRGEVGPDVEDYIVRYANFEWSHRRFDAIIRALPQMEPRDREVVRMRLADKIEDHLDLGMMYCTSAPRQHSFQTRRDKMIEMAETLNDSHLADEWRRISAETLATEDLGVRFAPNDRSFTIPGASYRMRLPLAVVRFGTRVGSRLRKRLRNPAAAPAESQHTLETV